MRETQAARACTEMRQQPEVAWANDAAIAREISGRQLHAPEKLQKSAK
jgi:hypothetical protein